MNSRNKGKAGELELAAYLREKGYEARRGVQYHGGSDSPDVIGLPGVHIECKRVDDTGASLVYTWLDQAIADAGADHVPTVWHRRSKSRKRDAGYQGWIVIMRADDFVTLHRGY